jgi:hypothetical protein
MFASGKSLAPQDALRADLTGRGPNMLVFRLLIRPERLLKALYEGR